MTLTLLPVRKERLVHRPYIILAALQVLDVVTTWLILHNWSVRAEGNPIVASLLDGAGLTLGLGLVLVFKLAVVYLFWSCQSGAKIATAIYSMVVFNNLLFLILWLTSRGA
jgi:hypothetical protein